MKRYFSIFILTMLFAFSVFAQTEAARQIDELGKTNSEILEARLDSYASELADNPNSFLQILIHRGEKESPGSPYRFGAVMKTSLVTKSKFFQDRIIVTNCKAEKERYIQVWLLTNKINQKTCEGEQLNFNTTTLFDSAYFSNPEVGNCCLVDELGDVGVYASLVAFAEELKKSPESKAYIFVYRGTNVYWTSYDGKSEKAVRKLDSLAHIRRIQNYAVKIFAEYEIDASRIILKSGGYKDSSGNIELWLVPKGGEIPQPKPDYFPKKRRSKKK